MAMSFNIHTISMVEGIIPFVFICNFSQCTMIVLFWCIREELISPEMYTWNISKFNFITIFIFDSCDIVMNVVEVYLCFFTIFSLNTTIPFKYCTQSMFRKFIPVIVRDEHRICKFFTYTKTIIATCIMYFMNSMSPI